MRRWFYGPTVTLQDCLAAFFSDDELKGDNMYSCGKCKKLRNGVKNSRIQRLPEVLCIHLKRFRHEYSCSKISTYVSFPVEGLDMSPYISDNCESDVHIYDLFGVINHHGNASGGHYTAHCLNFEAQQWFEFDDQVVTEVDVGAVMNSEAYVLFYRKQTDGMAADRQKASDLQNANEPTLLKFYVSKQWLNKFNTFAEPGPITNHDFLCPHGGVPPHKLSSVDMMILCVSQHMWDFLYSRYGGGPPCNHIYACTTCEKAAKYLRARQQQEMDTFLQMNRKYEESDEWPEILAVSMAWFKEWETFVRGKSEVPPGPIDNSSICILKNGVYVLRPNSDFAQIYGDIWRYLVGIYGGGPELVFRQSPATLLSQATALAASQASVPSRFTSSKAGTSSSTSAVSSAAPSVQPQPPAEQSGAVPAMSVPLEASFSSASSSTEKVSPMSVDSGLATSMGSIDKDDDEESVSSMQSEAKENDMDAEGEDSSSELLPESQEKDKEDGVGDRARTARREEEEDEDEDSSTELLPEDKDLGRECDSEDATAVLTSDGEIEADEDGDSSIEVLPEDKDSGKEAVCQDSTPLPASAGRKEVDKSSSEEVVEDSLSEVLGEHLENHLGQESMDSAASPSLAAKNSVVKRQGKKGRKSAEEVLVDLVAVDRECLSMTDREDVLQALIQCSKNDKLDRHGETSADLLSDTRRIKTDMGIPEAVCNNVEAHLENYLSPLTNSCDEKDSESHGQSKVEVREDAMFPAPHVPPEPRNDEREEKDFAADLLPEDRKKDLMMREKQEEEEEEEQQQEEDAITDSSKVLMNDYDLVSKVQQEEEDAEAGGDAGFALLLEDKEEKEEEEKISDLVSKVELEEKVDAEDFCPEVLSQDKRSKAEGGNAVAVQGSGSEVRVMDAGKEDSSSDLSAEVKV